MPLTRRTFTATATATLAASKAKAAATPLDVIVLGAGVAGLHAAWLLEQQGLRVTVLEGRRRVGGRVYTLTDLPGKPEMGFNAMGAGYGRSIDAAKRAGVTLYDAFPRFMRDFNQEIVLGGKIIPRASWAASPANPFPPALRKMPPWQVAPALLAMRSPLQNWADWLKPANAGLDVPLSQFLRAQGLDDAAIRLAYNTSPQYGDNAGGVSALLLEFESGWEKTQFAAGPQAFAVKGGNQKLTNGMAALLKGDILLGKTITAISAEGPLTTIRCRDGSSYAAKHAVCALPFSTLRQIAFEPGLSGSQARAVRALPYQPISVAFLTVKSPYWEKDGLAPSMWTDGALGMVMAQYFGENPDQVTGLTIQARGPVARHWDKLGRQGALAMLVDQIETLRPAARGQLHGAALQSWTTDPFSRGDWAYFAPGQITAFAAGMATPAGRVRFCGEHTATANRGMEGAMESAERAAVEVLTS